MKLLNNTIIFFKVLILIFSLQSWSKAEDIREFQIEGISVGDSLLDYFKKEEILKYLYPKSKKFAQTLQTGAREQFE